jgi:CHAT domain-containing protein/Tfp pilus assembly protein PilF
VSLAAGQAIIGVLEQGETDLAATVLAPTGETVAEFDGRERGDEWVVFAARDAGAYRVRVRTVRSAIPRTTFGLRWDLRPADRTVENYARAARLHTDAKKLYDKADRDSLTAAIDRFTRVRPLWASLGQPAWELAAMTGVGDALYLMSEYRPALDAFRAALEVCPNRCDARSEGEILNNMAMVSWPLGEIDNALAWLERAETLWHGIGFAYGEAIVISNHGILLWEAGEYDQARQRYERAMALFETLHDVRGRAYALNNLGVLLEALGENRQALSKFTQAITLFRRTHDAIAEGRAETRLARVYLAIGRRADAKAATERALALIRRTADRLAEADALVQHGRIEAGAGRGPVARGDFRHALEMYRTVGSRRGEADALHAIGVSHAADGDVANALSYLRDARDRRHELGLRALEAETLYELARVERSRGDLDAATRNAKSAIAIVDDLRSGVLEKQLRASYADSKQTYYAFYIGLLTERDQASPNSGFDRLAFEAAERAKARSLAELLRESWSGIAAEAHPELLRREQGLRKEINYWSWQLWQRTGRQAADTASVNTTLSRLIEDHDEAIADIRRSDPRYSEILSPRSLSVEDIQQAALDSRTVLLEFQLGEPTSYLWALTSDSLSLVRLPGRRTLEVQVRAYLDQVSTPTAAVDASLARRLADQLLKTAAPFLAGRRVVVVPDGILCRLPFAALPWPGQASPPPIVVMPSATSLVLLSNEVMARPTAPKTLAVVADPVYSSDDPRVNARVRSRRSSGANTLPWMTRLPYSRDEADRVLAFAPEPGRFRAVDFDANRAIVTGSELPQYRFVHFATHAVQDAVHPGLSGIVLSLVDENGKSQNGFLRLQDIYNLRLHADLVVLSACETGTGPESASDTSDSLARGLFHAGAARVVSTLWKVDDEATAYMMGLFYERVLREGVPAVDALRQAQAEMRRHPRWRSPFYWAGFVLQGRW